MTDGARRVRLTGPAEVAAFTMRFQPYTPVAGDHVLITLHSGSAIAAVARADSGTPPEWVGEVLDRFDDAQGVLVMVCGTWREGAEFARAYTDERLLDKVVVVGDRWTSATCDNVECCPPGGQMISAKVIARLERRGLPRVDGPTRAEVECEYLPDPVPAADVDFQWPTVLRVPLTFLQSEIGNIADRMGGVSTRRITAVIKTLTTQRDEALALLALVEGRELSASAEALALLCRQTPPAHRPDMLAVAAAVAYMSHDGLRGNVAVERALAEDPNHTLAALLSVLLGAGTSPEKVRAAFVTGGAV